MNNNKKVLSRNDFLYKIINILVVLFLADTYFFRKSTFCLLLLLFGMMFAIFICILDVKKYKLSNWCCLILLAESLVFIFSILNKRVDFYYQKMWLATVILTIWTDIQAKKDFTKLISSLKIGCYILLYIDLISLLFGNYAGANHILSLVGHKNYHAYLLLFTLSFDFLDAYLKNKKKLKFSIFFTSLFFLFVMRIYSSASMIIGLSFFYFLLMLQSILPKKLNVFKYFLFFYIVIEIVIVFIGNIDFIENILLEFNRDITFSGRTFMWKNAFELFKSNVFVGHGYLAQVITANSLNVYNNCHNYILNLLISGGIIYFIIYCIIYNKIYKNIQNNQFGDWGKVYVSILCTLLLMGLTETVIITNSLFIPLLLIGCFENRKLEQKV